METVANARAEPVDARRPPSGGSSPDSSDDWASLDALAFDTSLSFLAEADATPVPAPVLARSHPASPALEPVQSAPVNAPTTALDTDDVSDTDAESRLPLGDAATSSDGGVSPTSSGSPAPALSSTAEARPKRVCVTSRVRQKQEIAYLREQVAALESELAERTQRALDGQQTAAPSMWQHIAQRQLSEKLRAERENATLCNLLEGQLRVARSLERLLRKRVHSETDSVLMNTKRARGAAAFDLEAAMNEIRARVSDQLGSVDAVMRESGLASMSTDYDDARARFDPKVNGICMELSTVKLYPFPLAEVVDAMWQSACGGKDNSGRQTDLEVSVQIHARRSTAHVLLHGVCERRVEADRALIVFENIGRVEGPLVDGEDINCREFGYVLVEPGPPSSDNTPSTIVKACARMWPEADVEVEAQQTREVGLFVDLVVGFYNEHTQAILQAVENVLLSRSTGT